MVDFTTVSLTDRMKVNYKWRHLGESYSKLFFLLVGALLEAPSATAAGEGAAGWHWREEEGERGERRGAPEGYTAA